MSEGKREFAVLLVFIFSVASLIFFLKFPGPNLSGDLEKQVDAVIYEVRNSGKLPTVEEDFVEDGFSNLSAHDLNIVIGHESGEKYLQLIFSHLQKSLPRNWDSGFDRTIRLYLYDDRFVGKTNNALSTQTTSIYVGATLFLSAKNEAEIAAILSHEISHIILRHSAESRKIIRNLVYMEHKCFLTGNLEKASLVSLAVDKLFGSQGFVGTLILEQEMEADKTGQIILKDSGYNDLALVPVMDRMMKMNNNSYSFAVMSKRIAEIEHSSLSSGVSAGLKGKDFLVSNVLDLSIVQTALMQYLNETALK